MTGCGWALLLVHLLLLAVHARSSLTVHSSRSLTSVTDASPLTAPMHCYVSEARQWQCPPDSYEPGYANLTHFRVQCIEDFIALTVVRFTLDQTADSLVLQLFANITSDGHTEQDNAAIAVEYPRLVGSFLPPFAPSSTVPLGYYEWLNTHITLPLTSGVVHGVYYLLNQDNARVACLQFTVTYGLLSPSSSTATASSSTGGASNDADDNLAWRVEVGIIVVLVVVVVVPLLLILVGLWRRQRGWRVVSPMGWRLPVAPPVVRNEEGGGGMPGELDEDLLQEELPVIVEE